MNELIKNAIEEYIQMLSGAEVVSKPHCVRPASKRTSEASKCYLIDERFCILAQKKIAFIMGKVASLPDSNGVDAEILDELANLRNFFNRKELRGYSDKLKDSIDLERFIKPWMPTSKG